MGLHESGMDLLRLRVRVKNRCARLGCIEKNCLDNKD